MENIVWMMLVVCVVVIGGAAFLWRRGALSIDKDKAKGAVDDFVADTKKDVSKWRDDLEKK